MAASVRAHWANVIQRHDMKTHRLNFKMPDVFFLHAQKEIGFFPVNDEAIERKKEIVDG